MGYSWSVLTESSPACSWQGAVCSAGQKAEEEPLAWADPELGAVWHGPACSASCVAESGRGARVWNCSTLPRVAKSCHLLLFRGWYHFTRG